MSSSENKKDFLYFLDIGLAGTLSRIIEIVSDPEYVWIEYVPLDNKLAKKFKYPYKVRKSDIYTVHGSKNLPGVQSSITLVYNKEPNSHMNRIINTLKEENEELKNRIKSMKMKIASDSATVEDVYSGYGKAIDNIKKATKGSRSQPAQSPLMADPLVARRSRPDAEYDDDNYDDFQY